MYIYRERETERERERCLPISIMSSIPPPPRTPPQAACEDPKKLGAREEGGCLYGNLTMISPTIISEKNLDLSEQPLPEG